MTDSLERCYHCHETVPPGTDYSLESKGERHRFCCPGCRAVAELISAEGLARFYEFRSAPGLKPVDRPGEARPWEVCDRPEVERRLVRSKGPDSSELRFRVDGINCAACTWLIDRGLRSLEGVADVAVNPVTREARVAFDPATTKVSRILEAVERFGFVPRPGVGSDLAAEAGAARDELKRLAVAGLGFAQVMTLSAALYLGAFKAMETSFTSFFVIASMLIATPVVLYSGAPIFRAALRDLTRGRLGMDVPVSLAILVALGASLVNAFRGAGHVYFDSATMFVFFLTLGRFLEARARHKAGGFVSAISEVRPLSAIRRREGGDEHVGTVELVPGDVVVVPPGETVPADGDLVSATAAFDESLLSGESLARRRQSGDPVLGGSLNLGHAPIEVRVTQSGDDGYIDRVGDLLHRAMSERPEFLRMADRWAGFFVAAVLGLTVLTGGIWMLRDSARAVDVVLAMLVVTCPCALSLAAPTAFAVALGRFAQHGLLCRSARVIERIGQVHTWLFDKTGTLTEGRIGVIRVDALGELPEHRILEIAAALEAGIEHPIARAIRQLADSEPAEAIEFEAGRGVSGEVGGRRYRLGSAIHVGYESEPDDVACIYLGGEDGVLARLVLADRIRPHASDALASLALGANLALISGDSEPAVAAVARRLAVPEYRAGLMPEEKLDLLQERQRQGEVVAAVGDGINDAPFLAQADVSVAMVAGSQLAKASADVVFTGDDLRTLARLPALASATRRIVRQNLGWAAAYNLTVLPLAALGLLMPWMAALGMSLSSLVVVGNALRLSGILSEQTETREPTLDAVPAGGRLQP
ncbi:MAG: heavy metal translocating P-type ATPase [Gammaproteobacteria bacterium]|jgi:Cu2+-exporting ATPase